MAKKSQEIAAPKRKAAPPEAEPGPKSAPKVKRSRLKGKEPPQAAAEPLHKEKSAATRTKKVSTAKARDTKVVIGEEAVESPEISVSITAPIIDPIGDTTDGEGRFSLSENAGAEADAEMTAYQAETAEEAMDGTLENQSETVSQADKSQAAVQPDSELAVQAVGNGAAVVEKEHGAPESAPKLRPEAKLDRLQKILSQAGIASRRHAEEMIIAGRVMVNGQVVTQLGAKADPARDHIRVDGKLLSGAERHRYFMLNKPRGYVTTVSDPEGRPTVMQFFSKMSERLYPVGRLDYDSEGLLLVTNDGELANQLTRAASDVEKTYLVKVAGRLTESDLDQLRSGVRIERGAPGTEKVHTAPADIRQVRQGDNPWYEVVLIEGRNRELRKMFQTVGHFVEKIRRVGYGPLVLDLEPGKLRELSAEEVSSLRLAAEGKWKKKRPAKTGLRPRDEKPGTAHADFGRRGRKPDRAQTGRMQRGESGRPAVPREAGSRMRDAGERRTGDFGQRGPGPRPGRGPERPFQRQQSGKPFRESAGWKPREERSGAGSRSQEHGFGARSQQWQRGPNYENAPRGRDRSPGKKFGEGRGRRFGEGSRRGSENRNSRPDKTQDRTWDRTDNRRHAGGGSERGFRGPFNRDRDQRPAPEGREKPPFGSDDRSADRGPRGFTPGRFSKPGGRRFGSGPRGKPPGGGKRGGGAGR